ncbi:hypothetical protein GCM10010191_88540 [Actinomadura vinacea]|uniref:Uncharacterized protein n=1 Tax=Actinomadura vinacea TaxID=115336 RepID=A0ABN3KFQ4_9ACTN
MSLVIAIMAIVSIPGLVLLLFAFAVIDRIGHAANSSRLRLPWRKTADGRPMAAAGFEELHAVYGSSKRHEIDQRQSALMLRDDEGDDAPPRSRVDLDTGTATIRIAPASPE